MCYIFNLLSLEILFTLLCKSKYITDKEMQKNQLCIIKIEINYRLTNK